MGKQTDNRLPDTGALLVFIKNFTAAISNMKLFFLEHPQVVSAIDETVAALQALSGRGTLVLLRVDETLVVNGKAVKEGSPAIRKFIQVLGENDLESISFGHGLSRAELIDFLQPLVSKNKTPLRSSACISLGKISTRRHPGADIREHTILDLSEPEALETSLDPEIPGITELKDIFDRMGKNKSRGAESEQARNPINGMGTGTPGLFDQTILNGMLSEINTDSSQVSELTRALELFINGFILTIHPMEYLGSIKHHDEYTFVHAVNVFVLTMAQAQYLGFTGKQLHDIGVAAVLHDVGKLFIPDGIINKPGFLTDEERSVMQTHSMLGARYLMNVKGISRLAPICAMDHHIRFNGSGYPVIPNWKPCLVSQMIAISDAFDAMRSRRPYQEPKPQRLVIDILQKESGTAFNPALVENFLKLLGISLVNE